MPSLLSAALRAFASLFTPGMFVLLITTVLCTLLGLLLLVLFISGLALHEAGRIHNSEMAMLTALGGPMAALFIAWFLFPAIMPVVVSFFDNKVAAVVEKHDYAYLPRARPSAFGPEMLHDLGFSLKAVLLNILCLPLYLVPFINIFVFYALNGYLLGTEFFLMAARRYVAAVEAEALRKESARAIFVGGALLAFGATVPFVNLLAPFWGVALMTHLFHIIYEQKRVHFLPTQQDGPGVPPDPLMLK